MMGDQNGTACLDESRPAEAGNQAGSLHEHGVRLSGGRWTREGGCFD